jgi:hypothetical protein
VHYINVASKSSELTWTFCIDDENGDRQIVEYSVTLQQCVDCISAESVMRATQIQFVHERIEVTSIIDNKKTRKAVLIDTNVDGVFKPAARLHSLVAVDKGIKENLIVAKRLSEELKL